MHSSNTGGNQASAKAVLLFHLFLVSALIPPRAFGDIGVDVAAISGRTGGFGCFAWAGQKAGYAEFDALAIRYVRTTRDNDSWTDFRTFRAFCEQRKIQWVYTLWQAPSAYKDGSNMLKDPAGFARYWKDVVAELDAHQCRPEFVDLMNEPDSKGVWSTGITPAAMNILISAVRREFDLAGYFNVGIAGPNLTSMSDWSGPKDYFQAMDADAVKALSAFASHPWGDDVARAGCQGGADCTTQTWPAFGETARAKDPGKPIWVLEYATRQYTYDGIAYPDPDKVGQYNASFTMPYAVRTYENTLAFLNLGVTVPFYWDAADAPGSSKQWGYLDERGARKPIYETLKALFPHVAAGSAILKTIQDSALYAGAYLHDTDMTLAIANDSKTLRTATVRFTHAGPSLSMAGAIAVETAERKDPALKQADVSIVSAKALSLIDAGDGAYTLRVLVPGYSVLTVSLIRKAAATGVQAILSSSRSASQSEDQSASAEESADRNSYSHVWSGHDALGRAESFRFSPGTGKVPK